MIPSFIGSSGKTFYVIPDTTIRDTWVISGKCKTPGVACDRFCLEWGNRFKEADSKGTFKSLATSPLTFTY